MSTMIITTAFAALYNRILTAIVILQIEAKLQGITDKMITYSRPIAVLALTLAVITYIAEPALPEWARENKGVVRRVLFALMCIGLIPDMVELIAA